MHFLVLLCYIASIVLSYSTAGLKDLLYELGLAMLGVDGGSTGPLLGSLLMGMSDALAPAIDALQQAAEAGPDILTALQKAAEAAEAGVVSTKDLQARFGRAKNLGERTIGHQDPGATSTALLFKGFVEGLAE